MTSSDRREARRKRRKARREKKRLEYAKRLCETESVFNVATYAKAYGKVRKASPWKASTQAHGANLLTNAGEQVSALLNGTWVPKGFTEFDIIERGKPRHIRSVKVAEKCVQAAFCNECLVPLFSRSLIYDNGASLPGKGTDFALERFKKHLREHSRKHKGGYIFFFDFARYFDSIPHDRLIESVKSKMPSPELTALYEKIIREVQGGYGLGLGSQVSQISAVYYPNPIDHWVKSTLGVKGYGRYMDDGYIISEDLEKLQKIAHEFKERCNAMGITPNEKKCRIIGIHEPFIFLKTKFQVTQTGKVITRLNPKSATKERRRLRKMKRLVEEGRKPFREVEVEFNAWLCNLKRGKGYHMAVRMIKYFNSLFIGYGGFTIRAKGKGKAARTIRQAKRESGNE